ncbi:MAG: glycosyltransferase family 4 protein [Kiritimatiellia bacterium]|jgi:glycosyltransferase involved in cell wall biosynthesis
MRVLIVTQYFWPEEFRINDLALGLKERGHQVAVLTGKPNYPGGAFFPEYSFFARAREDYHGISVRRVPLISRGNGKGLRLLLNYFSFAFLASLLAPLLCREKYDVIFVYQPSPITVAIPALLLRYLKRVPVILWVLDLWPESLSATGAVRSRWVLSWVDRLVRVIYSRCDKILLSSRSFAGSIRQKNVPADKLSYFPNSAEELYRPESLPADAAERRLIPSGFNIIFAGNIGAAQDFETILAAAEKLSAYPDIHWIILGDGRSRAWVDGQVKDRSLSGQVHLLGRFSLEAMPRFFALADVLLVTLRKDPIFALTIPGKIQSYLACAKPVVAALDGEGGRVIEEAGAGIAVPAGDTNALTNAILRMYRMTSEARQAMGRNGRLYYERHFDREHLLDQLIQWGDMLAKKSGP